MTAKFITSDGTPTTADDPKRQVWYAVKCGYWTDDWSRLELYGPGIPGCPKCSCPGFQIDAGKWFTGAGDYDAAHAGYFDFLSTHKEKCYAHYPRGLWTVWEMHYDGKSADGHKEGGD